MLCYTIALNFFYILIGVATSSACVSTVFIYYVFITFQNSMCLENQQTLHNRLKKLKLQEEKSMREKLKEYKEKGNIFIYNVIMKFY